MKALDGKKRLVLMSFSMVLGISFSRLVFLKSISAALTTLTTFRSPANIACIALAGFFTANISAFFFLSPAVLRLAAWKVRSDFSLVRWLLKRSARSWAAASLVRPSAYCSSELTHEVRAPQHFSLSCVTRTSMVVRLSDPVPACTSSLISRSYKAFASTTSFGEPDNFVVATSSKGSHGDQTRFQNVEANKRASAASDAPWLSALKVERTPLQASNYASQGSFFTFCYLVVITSK